MNRWLVIGVGNPLRRDDGVGPWLAETLQRDHPALIQALLCQQLTPELAEDIASYERVLFIDAGTENQPLQIFHLEPLPTSSALGHAQSAEQILYWTQKLFGKKVDAWIMVVPGSDFGYGLGFSAPCTQKAQEALKLFRTISP